MIDINIQTTLSGALGKMLLEVNTTIPNGQLLTLYGKSGAGKTTLLRILAGLFQPERGHLSFDNEIWFDHNKNINLPPQKRKIGFVFQDYALFPNMTVYENLHFALSKNQNPDIIKELIELIELGDLQHQKPATLSGGQQQRVALARALVQQPKLLLLDEPLSALDPEMRNKMQTYLLNVQKKYKLTTILVSHDEMEIRKMSTDILVLDQGKVTYRGAVSGVFPSARTKFPARILRVEKKNDRCKLIVKWEEQELIVFPKKDDLTNYQVGDDILLEVEVMGIERGDY